jgi:hypothetical protein
LIHTAKAFEQLREALHTHHAFCGIDWDHAQHFDLTAQISQLLVNRSGLSKSRLTGEALCKLVARSQLLVESQRGVCLTRTLKCRGSALPVTTELVTTCRSAEI